jgi:serine/threonine-protein kinase
MSSQREKQGTPRGAAASSKPDLPVSGADVPAVGEVIASKYEVEKVLGAGGMGIVVAARHHQLGQRVAIKFMRAEAALDTNAASRFLREARAAVALASEHVTKVLDVGVLDSGAPYMVMEYLNGIDLGEALHRDGPMSVSHALHVVLQACEGIAEAHSRGIVHRDLKPSNLFLTKHIDGTPLAKVLDFGISKMASFNSPDAGGGNTLTASGSVMGSPQYMSPEQVRNAKAVDARSDIWAIGVILYELFTGRGPFAGATLGDTLARIVADTPSSLRATRPDVPEGLEAVIMQCLERNVDRRIQSVGELAAKLLPFAPREAELSVQRITRLSRAAGSETIEAMPVSPEPPGEIRAPTPPAWHRSDTATSQPMGAPRRRSKAWAIAVASGASLVAIGTVTIYAMMPRTIERPVAASPGASSTATPPSSARPIEANFGAKAETWHQAPAIDEPPGPAADTAQSARPGVASVATSSPAAVHSSRTSVPVVPTPTKRPMPRSASAAPAASSAAPGPTDDLDPFSLLKHK